MKIFRLIFEQKCGSQMNHFSLDIQMRSKAWPLHPCDHKYLVSWVYFKLEVTLFSLFIPKFLDKTMHIFVHIINPAEGIWFIK